MGLTPGCGAIVETPGIGTCVVPGTGAGVKMGAGVVADQSHTGT